MFWFYTSKKVSDKTYMSRIIGHYGSWEPPGRFLCYCKFFFHFVQSLYAGIKIRLLKNISWSPNCKKSKINNFTSYFSHKIHWAGKKYFLTAFLKSWCYLLSFVRSHYVFFLKTKAFIFLATITDFERQLKNENIIFP